MATETKCGQDVRVFLYTGLKEMGHLQSEKGPFSSQFPAELFISFHHPNQFRQITFLLMCFVLIIIYLHLVLISSVNVRTD